MMKTNHRILMLICSSALFAACQKELHYDDISTPRFDSVNLVRLVKTSNYDQNDALLWSSQELYTYDDAGGKTLVLIKDSSANGISTFTETFHYDNQKRLVSFESTSLDGYYTGVTFQYASNGQLDKAVFDLANGEQLVNNFRHTTENNNKVITMFDTSMLGGRYTAYRPEVIKYTFNGSNQLLRQLEAETGPNKSGG